MSMKAEFDRIREGLLLQRDELKVQAHLARLEALEEWRDAEHKLEELESRLKGVTDEVREASEDVWASARTLGDDIRIAYDRIKAKISEGS